MGGLWHCYTHITLSLRWFCWSISPMLSWFLMKIIQNHYWLAIGSYPAVPSVLSDFCWWNQSLFSVLSHSWRTPCSVVHHLTIAIPSLHVWWVKAGQSCSTPSIQLSFYKKKTAPLVRFACHRSAQSLACCPATWRKCKAGICVCYFSGWWWLEHDWLIFIYFPIYWE